MSRLIIESGHAERQYWQDLWRYRELFYVLAWRDISVRYKQTVIGVLWAVIQPLLLTVIFSVISKMANFGSEGVPQPLWIFAAMLPWQFFAASLSSASQSLVSNANLISKVYFPRLIVPAGAVVTSMVDFLISLSIFFLMMAWYHVWSSFAISAMSFRSSSNSAFTFRPSCTRRPSYSNASRRNSPRFRGSIPSIRWSA
jgi:lipopolysaccharide transport system permease protein